MNDSVRFGVWMADNSLVQGGIVGSNYFIQVGSDARVLSHVYSGNRMAFGGSNIIDGNIAARNDARVGFNVIYAPGDANSFGPIRNGALLARGPVEINDNNSVRGPVYLLKPFSYGGPVPTTGIVEERDALEAPKMPALPFPTNFPAIGRGNATGGQTIAPGSYADLLLNPGDSITFSVPGTYVFRTIRSTGATINFLVPAGNDDQYKIFVHEDVAIDGDNILLNGRGPLKNDDFPLATRLYTEVHGKGSTATGGHAFRIGDVTGTVVTSSFWAGTVYAPYGSISLGQTGTRGTTYLVMQGALWSKTRVFVGENVQLHFIPLQFAPVLIDPYFPPPADGKVGDKIGAELTSISQNPGVISAIPNNNLFRIDTVTQKVMIEVIAISPNDQALLSHLVSNGFELVSQSPDRLTLTGFYPISRLVNMNGRADIDHVRPLYQPINNAGQVTSQGDATMRSDLVRSRFGIEGTGVKVGILSDSWNSRGGAGQDILEGDLPADVELVPAFPVSGIDEGRAMAQIVHDVAPKAKLVFRTGCASPLDLALGIQQLAGPGYNCQVIVDDITYITEPFLKDGMVAQSVNDVVTNKKVTYITSAGNFGSKSFEGTFTPLSGAVLPSGISGVAHSFNGAKSQKLHLKRGNYTIVLQWDDQFYSLGGNAGAAVDLDFFLWQPATGSYFGFNRNNITADPIEVLPFNVNEDTDAELLIVRAGGLANVKFKYIIFRGEATIEGHAGSSTIVGQANAEKAISVGAMLYDNVNNIVPDYPSVASFSSRGGTAVNNLVRQKPDLVAPNGVNTTVTLNEDPVTNIELDPFPNFFGTSAAAPHAAGVVALLIEGRKKFNLQAEVTPAEIENMLQSTAQDLHEPGFDFKSGAGAIKADSAMLTIANARPVINSLEAPPGLAPDNAVPFEVTVRGRYLNAQTKIYIRGESIPTNFVNSSTVTATVTGPIADDPAIQLYNPPKSASGLDGGLSEAVRFFGNKQRVIIQADNKTKKYGESLPAFSFTVTIDGVPMSNTALTLQNLKLDGSNVQFNTFAEAISNVANYSVTPVRAAPLNPSVSADSALLAKYTFEFKAGTLTVQKLPVKITPKNQTLSYGDFPAAVDYNFDYGSVSIPGSLQKSIDSTYKTYLADNILAVVNGLPTPVPSTTLSIANNMSTMASFQAIRNSRKFLLQNGILTPASGPIPDDQMAGQRMLVDLAAQSLTNYKNDSANIQLVPAPPDDKWRGLISARALANGTAKASLPNGQLRGVVNGQLLPVVNGQWQAVVNGQLRAVVNGVLQNADDIMFYNGQLRAVVNGAWVVATSGQIQTTIDGQSITVDLSVENGQLRAVVNGQLMAVVNGQLQAVVNGQLLAIVNGQLQAVVNGQLMPVVNGQLRAVVNGQLQPVVNGQLLAVVNGELVAVENVEVLPNGQLRGVVNGQLQPIVNGQLLAVVNGQLMGMVNGQLMAVVNGYLTFVVFNGQLRAVVNGQLHPVVNGQLRAVVNGTLQGVDGVTITNGQLRAVVNGVSYDLLNGQLRAVVNGQLQPVVNNFGGVSQTSNSNAAVIMDGDDMAIQDGALGGLFAINTITGLNPGVQKLIPGTFYHPNLDVSYGLGDVTILPGLTDNVSTSTVWYRDFDGDGFGNPASMKRAVSQPAGYAANKLDCNDYKITYEDKDNDGWGTAKMIPCGNISRTGDCNDNDNRVHSLQTFYRDSDGDSYGDAGKTIVLCSSVPPAGYVKNQLDCNDQDAKVYWMQTYYRDADADGLGNPNSKITICSATPPQGYVVNNRDTDDMPKAPVTAPVITMAKPKPELEEKERLAVAAFPNPASDKVRLHVEDGVITGNTPLVFDAAGRAQTGLPARKLNGSTLELTVATLPSGLYTVHLKTNVGYRTIRFTKL